MHKSGDLTIEAVENESAEAIEDAVILEEVTEKPKRAPRKKAVKVEE